MNGIDEAGRKATLATVCTLDDQTKPPGEAEVVPIRRRKASQA